MSSKTLKRTGIFISSVIVLVLLGRIFASPARIGHYLQRYVHNTYGVEIEFQDFDYDLYPLRLRANRLWIFNNPDKKDIFLETQKVEIGLPYESFWSDDFRIASLEVTSPVIRFENAPRAKAVETKAADAEPAGSFHIDRVKIHSGALRYSNFEITEILLEGSVESEGAELKSFQARFNQSLLTGDGVLHNWNKPKFRFDYNLQGNAADAGLLVPELPAVQGELVAHGTLEGEETMFVLDGEAESPALHIMDAAPFPADAKFRFDSSDSESPLSLTANWEGLSLQSLQKIIPSAPPISSLADGTLEYEGGSNIWKGEGNIHVHLEPISTGEFRPSAFVNGRLANERFQFEINDLLLERTSAHIAGSLNDEDLDVHVMAEMDSLSDLRYFDPRLKDVPGSYRADLQIHGPYDDPILEGTVAGQDSRFEIHGTGSLRPVTLQMNVQVDGDLDPSLIDPRLFGRVKISGSANGNVSRPVLEASVQGTKVGFENFTVGDFDAQIQSNGHTLTADAAIPSLSISARLTHSLVDHTFLLEANLQGLQIEPFLPVLPEVLRDVNGRVSGILEASGTVNHLDQTRATLTLKEAQLNKGEWSVRIPEGSSIRLEDYTLRADLEAILPQGRLHAKGTFPLNTAKPMDIAIEGTGDLSLWKSNDYELKGGIELDGRITGTMQAPVYSGEAKLHDCELLWPSKSLHVERASGTIVLAENRVQVTANGMWNAAPVVLNGTVPLVPGSEGEIHAQISSVDIKTVLPEQDVAGKVSITADASGIGTSLADWKLDATLEPTDLLIAGKQVQAESLRIRTNQRIVELLPFRASVPSLLDLSGQGKLNLDTMEINGTMALDSDISMLSAWLPDLRGSGNARLELQLNGTTKEPEIHGALYLQNASLRIPNYPFVLEQINLQAPLEGDRVRIDSLTARMGGGSIQGTGEFTFQGKSAGEVLLQISARNVGTNYPRDFRGLWNADLTFSGKKEYQLSGKVLLLRSAYRDDINPQGRLLNTLLDQKRALLPVPEKTSEARVSLDLTIETEQDVFVENNLARMKAGAFLTATGNLYQPVFSGRMEVRHDSKLFFEGRTYSVDVATVDFLGRRELNPDLNISMTTDLVFDNQPCQAKLKISGSLNDPEVDASTTCQRWSEDFAGSEVYGLLLTGTPDPLQNPKDLFARQLSSFLTGTLLFNIQQKIARSIGLDRIQIEPLNIATENDPGARFTLTKRIPPLQLTYSLALSESTDQTWIADYRLGNFNISFLDQGDDRYTGRLQQRLRFGRGGTSRFQPFEQEFSRKPLVDSITIRSREPSMPEERIRKIIRLEPGDEYDYWNFQDRIVELQKGLQSEGFLFPQLEANEKEAESEQIALSIDIPAQQSREMLFTGWSPEKKRISIYRQWWREAFTTLAVPTQIQDDLYQALRAKGYHQATVDYSSEQSNGHVVEQFVVVPGPQYKKQTIRFSGTKALSETQLRQQLLAFYASENEMITEALNLFPRFLEKVSAVYVASGYMQATAAKEQVSYQPDQRALLLEVQITEGPQTTISELLVKGFDSFPSELLDELQLKEGGIYRPLLLFDDELTVENYFRSIGHWDAHTEATVAFTDETHVRLVYDIRSSGIARIAGIHITGNKTTRTGLIENRLGLNTGDVLVQEKLSRAQNRLFQMGVFEQVFVQALETDITNEYDIEVRIIERKNYELAYGMRYDSQKHLEGDVKLTDTNLFGMVNSLSGYARANSNERLYQIQYGSPFLLGWNWNAFFLAERKRELDPYFLTTTYSFQQQNHLPSQFELFLGYKYRKTKTLIFDPILEEELEFTLQLPRLMASLFRETRDNPLNAKQGMFLSSSFEYAASFLGSDLPFIKNYNQFYTYIPFARMTWASGIRIGLAFTEGDQRLIGSERFFAGGSDTIRGFTYRSIGPVNEFTGEPQGGEAVLIVNQELRVPLYRWIHGVVFYDGGNVYLKPTDLSFGDFRHSAGFGIRVELPYGIVTRFDLGFNLDPRQNEQKSVFHFSLGQAF